MRSKQLQYYGHFSEILMVTNKVSLRLEMSSNDHLTFEGDAATCLEAIRMFLSYLATDKKHVNGSAGETSFGPAINVLQLPDKIITAEKSDARQQLKAKLR